MKKLFILLSSFIILAIILGGCGGGSPSTVEEPVAEVNMPVEEHAPVTLTFWDSATNNPVDIVTKSMIEEFMEKYPWITVNEESFSFSEYFTKVDTATAGGNAPDVLWVDVTEVPRYAFYETIIPLNDFLPADFLDDWYPGPAGDMQFDGKIWAIPLHQSSEVTLYNKEIVEAAGLEIPKSYDEAWTLDEFRDALKKVTKVNADGTTEVWGWTTNYGLSFYNWQPLMASFGGIVMNEDKTTYHGFLDSDETIAAAEWIAQLHIDGLAPIERTPDMFQTGKVAFLESTAIVMVDIQNRYPDLQIGAMPNPCGARCAQNAGGWHLGISSQTEYPEEAWMLVDFMTNKEGHKEWITRTGYLPGRISVYEELPELKEYPYDIFMDGLINYPVQRPVTLGYQFFNSIMTQAILDMNLGADVSETLERVANDAQAELDSFK